MYCFRLPRKTDIERKIEIYTFSARTRQLFVRLLALVKWANSASKVDKSAVSICLIYIMSIKSPFFISYSTTTWRLDALRNPNLSHLPYSAICFEVPFIIKLISNTVICSYLYLFKFPSKYILVIYLFCCSIQVVLFLRCSLYVISHSAQTKLLLNKT